MDWKTATEIIKRTIDCRQYLQQSKGGLYVCPYCGSGENGHNNTGALKYYQQTNTWTCFACKSQRRAKYSGDVIDLYQQETGATVHDAILDLAQQAGITERIEFGHTRSAAAAAPAGNLSLIGTTEQEPAAADATAEPPANYQKYYARCKQNLIESAEAQAYLQSRGISLDLALQYFVGFDPAWISPTVIKRQQEKGSNWLPEPKPVIILPSTMQHYVARDIRQVEDIPEQQRADFERYKKVNEGTPDIFGGYKAFSSGAENIFVCEGAFDALAIMETGATAIALNSTANADKLIKQLEQQPTQATLILAFDNDTTGKIATEKLGEGLQRLNISYVTADISGAYKDPNEALTADRAAFEQAIAKAIASTAARPDNTAAYLDFLMAGEIEKFKQTRNRLTGFANLDEKAGGLNAGLYVLAAIPSLGKTTFALQMADQLAAAGHEVVFFSMEQSRLEMVSKSLSRLTAQADLKTAVTSLSIRRGYLPAQVTAAAEQYKAQTGERLSLIECNYNADIRYIADYIRRYKQRTGTTPIVFVDYLQVLQPAADGKSRASKKDEVDLSMIELKQLSREQDATIIVISSINRSNYLVPISYESLKESGNIEFGADVIWGLQLACLDEPLFDGKENIKAKRQRANEAKAENPRKVKLVCLKNRYGISNFSCQFVYYPQHDLFLPAADTTPHQQAKRVAIGGKR